MKCVKSLYIFRSGRSYSASPFVIQLYGFVSMRPPTCNQVFRTSKAYWVPFRDCGGHYLVLATQPPVWGNQNFRKHHLFQALFILEMFSRVRKDQDWFLWFLVTWHPADAVGLILAISIEMITGVKWSDRYLWTIFSCVIFCVCGKKWCHLSLFSVTWRMVHWTAITLSEFYFCFNKAKMA